MLNLRNITIALAAFLIAAALFSIYSLKKNLEKGTARLGADIMVVPVEAEPVDMNALLAGEPSSFYMDRHFEDEVAKVQGVKTVAGQLYLKTQRLGCCTVGDVMVTAFDQEKDFTIIPWLEDELDRPLNYNEVVIGDELFSLILEAREKPGDKKRSLVRLLGTNFRIVSMLDDTGIEFIDNTVFITFKALKRITSGPPPEPPGNPDQTNRLVRNELSRRIEERQALIKLENKVSVFLVQTEPDTDPRRVAALIEHYNPDVKAIVANEINISAKKKFIIILKSVYMINVILFIIMSLLTGLLIRFSCGKGD